MGAYQQTGNIAKMVETATKVSQIDPNNLKALALLVVASGSRRKRHRTCRCGAVRREGAPGAPDVAQARRNGGRRFSEIQNANQRDLQRRSRHDAVSETKILRKQSSICGLLWMRIQPM